MITRPTRHRTPTASATPPQGTTTMPATTRDATSRDMASRGAAPGDAWTPPTWEQLVREHSPMVYRLAWRLTGNQHDAEDLTQDVFVKVFRSLHTFTPGTLEGWLHRITTNTFLDHARRRQRVRIDPYEDAGVRETGDLGQPDTTLDDAGLAPDLARALAALSPEQRVAVVLCDVEGLGQDEVARVLDVNPATVRSRIHRARRSMRAALAHREPRADHGRYLGMSDEYEMSEQPGGPGRPGR